MKRAIGLHTAAINHPIIIPVMKSKKAEKKKNPAPTSPKKKAKAIFHPHKS
jgi:hypothetical protein